MSRVAVRLRLNQALVYRQIVARMRRGSLRARRAVQLFADGPDALQQRLAPFPVRIAGTIPIGCELPDSDLDIALAFSQRAQAAEFIFDQLSRLQPRNAPTRHGFVVRFTLQGFPIEIYCANMDVERQDAFLHLTVEERLLRLSDSLSGGRRRATAEIRRRKARGMNTEAAFCDYFRLGGEPFRTLRDLAKAPDFMLRRLSGRLRSGRLSS